MFHKMIGERLPENYTWMDLHQPKRNKLSYLSYRYFNLTYANSMLLDPKWTKALFVRNPHERLVSAYLDKGIRSDEVTRSCCRKTRNCWKEDKSFRHFVYSIMEKCNNSYEVNSVDLMQSF